MRRDVREDGIERIEAKDGMELGKEIREVREVEISEVKKGFQVMEVVEEFNYREDTVYDNVRTYLCTYLLSTFCSFVISLGSNGLFFFLFLLFGSFSSPSPSNWKKEGDSWKKEKEKEGKKNRKE